METAEHQNQDRSTPGYRLAQPRSHPGVRFRTLGAQPQVHYPRIRAGVGTTYPRLTATEGQRHYRLGRDWAAGVAIGGTGPSRPPCPTQPRVRTRRREHRARRRTVRASARSGDSGPPADEGEPHPERGGA